MSDRNWLCRFFGHRFAVHIWGRAGTGYIRDEVCERCGLERSATEEPPR